MAYYYLSDLHLCHKQIALRRGFPSTWAHDQALLDGLRQRVTPNDTLFLLGDLFAYTFDRSILEQLSGVSHSMVLILGNHETQHWLKKADSRLLCCAFSDILPSAQIIDEERSVWLCHEPCPDLAADGDYLLHGHLHLAPPRREDWRRLCLQKNILNVGADLSHYVSGKFIPATLDEWNFFNEVWKADMF